MTTDPSATGHIGRDWSDPSEPGVPAAALQDGYHWLGYQAAQWSPDSWSWILGQISCHFCPEEIDHMNYIGPRVPPSSSQQTV